jgi:hypothetical protein
MQFLHRNKKPFKIYGKLWINLEITIKDGLQLYADTLNSE